MRTGGKHTKPRFDPCMQQKWLKGPRPLETPMIPTGTGDKLQVFVAGPFEQQTREHNANRQSKIPYGLFEVFCRQGARHKCRTILGCKTFFWKGKKSPQHSLTTENVQSPWGLNARGKRGIRNYERLRERRQAEKWKRNKRKRTESGTP